MADAPTQPDQAEGPRKDGDPKEARGGGQGRSAPQPAEGADDAPAGGTGSPRR